MEINKTATAIFNWQYIFDIAMEHKKDLIIANILAIFAVLAVVPIPLLLPLLVDEVLLEQPGRLIQIMDQLFPAAWYGPVLYISCILFATILLRLSALLLTVFHNRQFTLISKDIVFRIRKILLKHLQRISMAEHECLGSGSVASFFVTDMNAIDDFVGQSVSKTLIAVLSLVGITCVLLWMQWQLAVFILLLNPLVIYFTVVLGKKVKHLKKHENLAFEVFQESLTETLDGIQQIRAANREQYYLNRVINKALDIKHHAALFSWKSDAANRFSFAVFLIGFDVFRAISMLMVVYSDLSVGEMMAVFAYLWFMMSPVQELLNLQYAYYAAKAALLRINTLVAMKQEPHYPHIKNPFKGQTTASIQLNNIHFHYGDNEPVLNGVSLHIHAGEKVALVGASGGGKSTLVQVILGMYPADSGQLLFNDVPVTEIGIDVVRDNVATVLQHPAMFNDSIRNNLTLGNNKTDQQLWQALEVAQLDELIKNMSEQLDTIIGKQGVRLSGGQQQRLAIARMILSDPKVVILDEATSSLDIHTELHLHKALNEFLKNRTTLIIAHRLSAVKQADRAYVFEDGQVIEEGDHERLIEGGGLYQKLYGKHH
ncbi:MAG: ABC transporter ATP-binding protein [Pseudomonadota bacterium]